MIINNQSQISSDLPLQAAPTRRNLANMPAADGTQVGTSATQTMLAAQNTTSALSPVTNADAARALIQTLKKNFFANPGSAMLAQANQVPENALRLLQ